MKRQAIILSLLLYSILSHAQHVDKAKMDSLFAGIQNFERGMGSLSIFKDGKEVYRNSYGYSDFENKIKASYKTKYRIGSISKTFTATIIMKLVEEQKLQLNAKLSDYYPRIKNAEHITIGHLLQHRSGIANFTSAADYTKWNTQKHTKQQLLDRIISGGSNFEPDEKMEYSNSNYVLLTFVAEDITGKTYSRLLKEVIATPNGLQNTYVGTAINSKLNEAYSYRKLSTWTKEEETDLSIPLGAGNIVSTPTELNIFLHYLFSEKVVNAQSLAKMMSLKDNFGLGLFKVPFYDMVGYGHSGGIDGFQSNAYYFPESRVSIALTSNGVVYSLNDIVVGALSIYFGRPYKLPVFSESISLKSEQLLKYLGVYSIPTLPIKLTITQEGNTLIAQGTGQPSFPLEYMGKNKFKFDAAKVQLEFIPEENKMILIQGGMTFEMIRE